MLLSENRPEWPMAFFGVLRAGGVVVPVDADASAAEVANLAKASGARAVILSDEVRDRLGGALAAALDQRGQDPAVVDLAALFAPGPETPALPRLKADTLASVIFTSGTTGTPKGVMLTHRNFTSLTAKLTSVFDLKPAEGVLSVLPLHHTFEFTCGLLTPLAQGAEITYLGELTADALSDALRGGRITAMVGVPALWQTLHRRIEQDLEARGPWARELVHGIMSLNRELRDRTPINLGKLLFLPVHRRLGNVRFLVSGGSALPPEVLEAFQGLGFDLYEGYGLTEAAPVITVSRPGEGAKVGSVGQALPGLEVRISDPDGEGVGEVVARGPSVMQGYFGDTAATEATLEGGWLHTGDLGRLDADGNLYIVGRAKDVIVDAGGKNIYPDEIETLYGEHPYLLELCVVGLAETGSKGERVACLAVPDYEAGEQAGLSRDEVRAQVRAHFRDVGATLPLYRRIKVLHLWDGELPRTATRKVRRPMVVTELGRLERASRATGGKAPPPRREGAAWVTGLVAAVAQKQADQVRPEDKLVDDLGLDSLGLSELGAAVEEAGVRLPEGLEAELQGATVADLARIVAAAPRTSAKTPTKAPVAVGELELPEVVARLGTRALRLGQRAIYEQLLEVRVMGQEHLPTQGSVLVAANHSSHLDMGLVKHALGEQGDRLATLAARDYFFGTPLRRLYFGSFTNLLPMEREGSVRESLRLAGQALHRGHHLLIFPEGTRSTSGEMAPFLPSVGYLALQQKADVLPMYLGGTHDALPKGASLPKRMPLRVAIGPVIPVSVLAAATEGLGRQDTYRLATAIIEDAVCALRDARSKRTPAEIRAGLDGLGETRDARAQRAALDEAEGVAGADRTPDALPDDDAPAAAPHIEELDG